MNSRTKKKRRTVMKEILEEYAGKRHTLIMWMFAFNKELSQQNTFKSTRQVAQEFRKLKVELEGELIKEKGISSIDQSKIYSIYYTYKK